MSFLVNVDCARCVPPNCSRLWIVSDAVTDIDDKIIQGLLSWRPPRGEREFEEYLNWPACHALELDFELLDEVRLGQPDDDNYEVNPVDRVIYRGVVVASPSGSP